MAGEEGEARAEEAIDSTSGSSSLDQRCTFTLNEKRLPPGSILRRRQASLAKPDPFFLTLRAENGMGLATRD